MSLRHLSYWDFLYAGSGQFVLPNLRVSRAAFADDRERKAGVRFHFSKHVLEELEARKIARVLVDQLLQAPEQKVPEVEGITCFQSRVDIGGKQYLLRVMVNDSVDPPVVVTVYRTNKIAKYWRKP